MPMAMWASDTIDRLFWSWLIHFRWFFGHFCSLRAVISFYSFYFVEWKFRSFHFCFSHKFLSFWLLSVRFRFVVHLDWVSISTTNASCHTVNLWILFSFSNSHPLCIFWTTNSTAFSTYNFSFFSLDFFCRFCFVRILFLFFSVANDVNRCLCHFSLFFLCFPPFLLFFYFSLPISICTRIFHSTFLRPTKRKEKNISIFVI